MQFMLIILNKVELLDDILEEFMENGIKVRRFLIWNGSRTIKKQ